MYISGKLTNLNRCVFLQDSQNLNQDASTITAGFFQVQDRILPVFANLTNICPAEQVEPLPFPCEQNPTLVQGLFQGDDLLQSWLQADGENIHQYLSVVRVVFQAREVLRHRWASSSDLFYLFPTERLASPEAAKECSSNHSSSLRFNLHHCSICSIIRCRHPRYCCSRLTLHNSRISSRQTWGKRSNQRGDARESVIPYFFAAIKRQ
jgi:hypothetical protein